MIANGPTVFNKIDMSVPGPDHIAENILNFVDKAKKEAPAIDHKIAKNVFILLELCGLKKLLPSFPLFLSEGLSTPIKNIMRVMIQDTTKYQNVNPNFLKLWKLPFVKRNPNSMSANITGEPINPKNKHTKKNIYRFKG